MKPIEELRTALKTDLCVMNLPIGEITLSKLAVEQRIKDSHKAHIHQDGHAGAVKLLESCGLCKKTLDSTEIKKVFAEKHDKEETEWLNYRELTQAEQEEMSKTTQDNSFNVVAVRETDKFSNGYVLNGEKILISPIVKYDTKKESYKVEKNKEAVGNALKNLMLKFGKADLLAIFKGRPYLVRAEFERIIAYGIFFNNEVFDMEQLPKVDITFCKINEGIQNLFAQLKPVELETLTNEKVAYFKTITAQVEKAEVKAEAQTQVAINLIEP